MDSEGVLSRSEDCTVVGPIERNETEPENLPGWDEVGTQNPPCQLGKEAETAPLQYHPGEETLIRGDESDNERVIQDKSNNSFIGVQQNDTDIHSTRGQDNSRYSSSQTGKDVETMPLTNPLGEETLNCQDESDNETIILRPQSSNMGSNYMSQWLHNVEVLQNDENPLSDREQALLTRFYQESVDFRDKCLSTMHFDDYIIKNEINIKNFLCKVRESDRPEMVNIPPVPLIIGFQQDSNGIQCSTQ